eukprot:TRINITY_DN28402_c0_g1_i1.p2 TRINITY_DN28402_c0_g1~~TRINITY_DN28402_c0_g1_i1.p2  ORF type:complete len:156 (-),score=17.68 TRINITY_DN28402_c0_g1_i1:121-588(-)
MEASSSSPSPKDAPNIASSATTAARVAVVVVAVLSEPQLLCTTHGLDLFIPDTREEEGGPPLQHSTYPHNVAATFHFDILSLIAVIRMSLPRDDEPLLPPHNLVTRRVLRWARGTEGGKEVLTPTPIIVISFLLCGGGGGSPSCLLYTSPSPRDS